jgi:hypothetical protein
MAKSCIPAGEFYGTFCATGSVDNGKTIITARESHTHYLLRAMACNSVEAQTFSKNILFPSSVSKLMSGIQQAIGKQEPAIRDTFSRLTLSSILYTERVHCSGTSESFYQTLRRHIQNDTTINSHCLQTI